MCDNQIHGFRSVFFLEKSPDRKRPAILIQLTLHKPELKPGILLHHLKKMYQDEEVLLFFCTLFFISEALAFSLTPKIW